MRAHVFILALVLPGLACDGVASGDREGAGSGTAAIPSAEAAASAGPGVAGDPIRRLPPGAFTEVPAHVRDALSARGCLVPQSFATADPHNVVSGHLAAPGQLDWVALCSRDDSSRVVMIPGGPAGCGDPGVRNADRNWLQGLGGPAVEYSRRLGVRPAHEVAGFLAALGDTVPALEHDVLVDAFLEKAAELWYCRDGRWELLPGT